MDVRVAQQGREGLRTLARVGIGTKGALYLLVGALATWAALVDGRATGSEGALSTVARQPAGEVLLWVAAAGFVAYGIWKFAQALLDADRDGSDWKGLATRAGYVVSGVAHLGLAMAAAGLAHGDGIRESTPGAGLWGLPHGRWLVGVAGLVVIGLGVGQLVSAWRSEFMRRLDTAAMTVRELRSARTLGGVGTAARAVVFAIVGAFLVSAAVHADPDRARGVGGALRSLAEQPFGAVLLGVVAVGLAAYGLYCFTEARFRAVRV